MKSKLTLTFHSLKSSATGSQASSVEVKPAFMPSVHCMGVRWGSLLMDAYKLCNARQQPTLMQEVPMNTNDKTTTQRRIKIARD